MHCNFCSSAAVESMSCPGTPCNSAAEQNLCCTMQSSSGVEVLHDRQQADLETVLMKVHNFHTPNICVYIYICIYVY